MKKLGLTLFLCGAFALNASAAEESVAVSSAQLNVSKAKTDVLGRHNSKVRNTPQAFVKADVAKPRVLAKDAYYPSEERITATRGIFEHRNGKRWYALDTEENLPESKYLKKINDIEDKDRARAKYMKDHAQDKNTCPNTRFWEDIQLEKAYDDCVGKNNCTLLDKAVGKDPDTNEDVTENIDLWNYTAIEKNSYLYQTSINQGYTGNNIGVSVTDIGTPFVEYNHVPADKYVMLTMKGTTHGIAHATKTTWVLNHVVPGATIYGLDIVCGIFAPSNGYEKIPKVYIGNHSHGKPNKTYNAAEIDDFIYDTRTIEVASAGNAGLLNPDDGHISEMATGVNVISVGAVHNNLTYHQTSSWANPKYSKKGDPSFKGQSYVKPEIANFSDILFPDKGAAAYRYKKLSYEVIAPYFTQTSSSTPYTTASIALLLERYPFYRWHPEVVKALLLTSSIKKIIGAKDHDPDNGDYAMGVPDGRAIFEKNRSRFWNGNNEDFFVNKRISFTESGIQSGRKYRIAIAWLSSGTAVAQYGRLPQDINLKVKQNGRTIARSESTSNPFELVDFAAESGGDLEIIIERKEGKGENLGGRVLLGYNFLELPDAYQRR